MPVQEVSSSRGWRWWGSLLFAILWFAVGGYGLSQVATERADSAGMRSAETCGATTPSQGCLARVPGRITESRGGRRGSLRHHFVPASSSYGDDWIRFDGDTDLDGLSPGLALVLSGSEVPALYWEGEPVAFETPDGRVGTLTYDSDAWTRPLWWGLFSLALGTIALLTLRTGGIRRHVPRAAVRQGRGRTVVGLVAMTVLLASFVAFFCSGLGNQLIGFGITSAGWLSLLGGGWLLGRRRAATP